MALPKGFRAEGNCDYTDEEWAYIRAVRDWQDRTGKRFPAISDYLAIAKAMGYAVRAGVCRA